VSEVSLGDDKKQLQHCLVATLECEPHATTDGTGACASVCKELALKARLQTPCRTAYGSRTLPNALFIQLFFF